MKEYFTYILTNLKNTVLYIGVTNNLKLRLIQHTSNKNNSFVYKYNAIKLIYFERYININDAIGREKQLKRWHKEWKWNLVKTINAQLEDMSKYI
ncbi:MAG: GIY-YIG nuclease family protein [Candidatus Dojkabacteria bacterium]